MRNTDHKALRPLNELRTSAIPIQTSEMSCVSKDPRDKSMSVTPKELANTYNCRLDKQPLPIVNYIGHMRAQCICLLVHMYMCMCIGTHVYVHAY